MSPDEPTPSPGTPSAAWAVTSSSCCAEILRDDDDVCLIGDRIVRSIGAPYLESGRDLSVTGSVGIAVTHDPRAEPEQLVRNADAAMYEAKKAGRNRFRVYDHKLACGTCSPPAGDASTA